MNIDNKRYRNWLTSNIFLINGVIVIFNLTKLCIAKTFFYSTNTLYMGILFTTVDTLFSDIYLAMSLVDKVII